MNSVSVREVIGRVIGNTRVQDTYFVSMMNEWIPQAMGMMQTKQVLHKRWKPVLIEYHKGKLPCGMVGKPIAVEFRGGRLGYFSGQRAFDSPSSGTTSGARIGIMDDTTVFGTSFAQRATPEGGFITETELTQLSNLPEHQSGYYYTELDYVNTSMARACIIVHYLALPVDEQGFPLIPDVEVYKQALYWYCRAMMIGAGFPDKIFSFDKCWAQWIDFCGIAINEISYPTTDEMEARIEAAQRLVFPDGWANQFFEPLNPSGL